MSERNEIVEMAAKDIAASFDSQRYGIEPASIIALLTFVIPQLFQCFRDNDELSAEKMSARVHQLHKRDPKRLRTRVARNIMSRDRGLSKEQALALADAVVAQAIATDANTMSRAAAMSGCE